MRGSLSEELPPASNRVSKDPRVSLGPLSPSGHPDQSRRGLATSVMHPVCGMGRIEAAAPGSRAGRHPGPGSELPPLHARCRAEVLCGCGRCCPWLGTQQPSGPDSQKEGANPCLLQGRGEARLRSLPGAGAGCGQVCGELCQATQPQRLPQTPSVPAVHQTGACRTCGLFEEGDTLMPTSQMQHRGPESWSDMAQDGTAVTGHGW